MSIISATPIEKTVFRLTITYGSGIIENIVVSNTGEYNIHYIRNGRAFNRIGKILNVISTGVNKTSYILFEAKDDECNCKERIYFDYIQFIKDITPNDAYHIAVEHGFKGTVDEWLKSLHGDPGKDAYQIALSLGFMGSREEWLRSLIGPRGPIGPRGLTGLSAYEAAKSEGYEGTEKELYEALAKVGQHEETINEQNNRLEECESKLQWIEGL